MPRYGKTIGPLALISAAQDLTANWVDLGGEISTENVQNIGLYLNLDINDSQDARVRLLAKHTSGGTDEYTLPIRTVSASDVKVQPEYTEFAVDADQKMLVAAVLDAIVPFCQFQVQAGTVGASAGQIDGAHYVLGY